MIFLGTCAADGLPNPFCDCPLCEDARKNPQHGRLRTSFLLDERNLIDCGPDLASACTQAGIDLTRLENVFVTHTHEDHFEPSNAGLLSMSRSRKGKSVDIYLSQEAYDSLIAKFEVLTEAKLADSDACAEYRKGLVRLHPLTTGAWYEVGGYQIMTIPTTHRSSYQEYAVNYVFAKDSRKLLYACDTGYYPESSLELLREANLDVLIMECTWGDLFDKDTSSHMNCQAFLVQLKNLEQYGAISKSTRIYATHINHKHNLTHPMLQAWFDENSPYKVTVAHDGMRI